MQGSRRYWWWISIVSLLVVAVGLGFWWFNRPVEPPPPDEPPPIARDDALRLVALKNRAIAHLENGRSEQAAEDFAALREELPGELLAARNLAVARLFVLREALQAPAGPETQQQIDAAEQNATEAIESLKEIEPESFVPLLLESRMYRALAEKEPDEPEHAVRAKRAIVAAVESHDDRAFLWFERHLVQRYSQDAAEVDDAHRSLQQAFQLSPDNVVLIAELLAAEVRRQDRDLIPRLKTVRETLGPIAAAVRRHSSDFDLLQMLDRADAALADAENPDWGTARQQILPVRNLIRAELASKLDARLLEPHELEFLVTNFSPEFAGRADLPEPGFPEPIAVTFRAANGDRALPEWNDVRAFKLIDFDLNGRPDVVVARNRSVEVYGFDAGPGRWTLIAAAKLPFDPSGVAAADLDHDVVAADAARPGAKKVGENVVDPKEKQDAAKRPANDVGAAACATADPDLVVYGAGGFAVLRNTLDPESNRRSLVPIKQNDPFAALRDIFTVGVADLDHDSDLDLVVSTAAGTSLWMNDGNGAFEDATRFSTTPPAEFRPTVVVPIDVNRDVLTDVVLADPSQGMAGRLQNIRHGQFRFRRFGENADGTGFARSLLPLDATGNASWDWIAAGSHGVKLCTTQTVDSGGYRFVETTTVHDGPVDGATLLDYDNDGFQDVVAWTQAGFVVYRGGPDGAFRKVDDLFPDAPQNVTACEAADLDGDGDLDLVVLSDGGLTLLDNDGGNRNRWIDVSLRAQSHDVKFVEQRCNVHGVGSLIELKAGNRYQARIVDGSVVHFGLGKQEQADVVRVLWTNGIPQNEIAPATRQTLCSPQELLKGSCPYLYTWTGEKYEFFTDLLWAAPIGLQFADGVLAPAREWEYLKIPGDRLVPVDGEYRMQVTEELWEAAYFDSIRLIAVDHPADVEIFSNEKVGPPSIAEHRIHTVRNRRVPVAARDQNGRNVLPLIAKEDGDFLQAYDRRFTQGLTPEHWLELDLGKLDNPRRVTLFLTGWVFPSDTSINVWLSHQTKLKPPQPPSIRVPDKDGRWRNVVPYCGFPGGKTKTIAVDLSGKFLTDDYRVQIRTTMELRWDAAFFTVDEEPAEVRTTDVPVERAELYYRGFSRRIAGRNNGPETYDFRDVDRAPRWPPMDGRFTRFGDVTPLIRSDDDRLVVMGAGDAMTLRFPVPPNPVPPGWKRDFLIRNVGWDKDADLHTVLGQTVEPLPFRKMKSYPIRPGDQVPAGKDYEQYLKMYQTRRQSHAEFRRLLVDDHLVDDHPE